jgi:hypothetical protein
LYSQEEFGVELAHTAYAFDSTTIDLCLELFPWAHFRKKKGAVKAHTLLDLRGNIPCWVHVTNGSVHDVNTLDLLPIEPGAFYILDRGYLDFARLFKLSQQGAFFVTRSKSNTQMRRRYSRPVDKTTGLRCDQTIVLTGVLARRDYPENLRLVHFVDIETGKRLRFLTNNFFVPALTIAKLYRCRWQVELFFRWIKQHLRIKAFYGTSENAVKTQIWVAIATYVLVAIVKKRHGLEEMSLYTILQICSVSAFEKTPISEAFANLYSQRNDLVQRNLQLTLDF